VVTDGVLHVTPVVVLCHFGPAAQPRHGATLPSTERSSGPQAPQDPVGPSWFTLLPTRWRMEREK